MQRFLVSPALVASAAPTLEGAIARQIAVVLRQRPGEEVLLFDGQGAEARCILLEVSPRQVRLQSVERRASLPDIGMRLHLFAALLKGPRFEVTLQKATELGVAAVTPVRARRGVAKGAAPTPRWRSIVREATEQSGRATPPNLLPTVSFGEACRQAATMERAICCSLQGGDLRAALAPPPRALAVLTGPEGGFEAEEEELARRQGIGLVSLGPHILRAETAAIAACAAAFCLAGAWATGDGDEEMRG